MHLLQPLHSFLDRRRHRKSFAFQATTDTAETHRIFELKQWQAWEEVGYFIEGKLGVANCEGCRKKILITRHVRYHDVDTIRFEQDVEKKTGRCVFEAPVTFGIEFRTVKENYAEKRNLYTDSCPEWEDYVLIKETKYCEVQSVRCASRFEFFNHVRKYKGEDFLRWCLAGKQKGAKKGAL